MDRPAWEKLARLDSHSSPDRYSDWARLARLIRYYILTMTTVAGSGHATSSLSAVDLATALFFKYFRFEFKDRNNRGNDRLIFSKGHASPLFYALYAAAGQIPETDLLKYRTFESTLEGHPTPRFPFTEAATGSLGQGLSVGAGEALAMRREKLGSRVWVLLGDGELAEGSVWEAAAFASFHKLNNLIAIIDVNRLGQSEETMYEHQTQVYQRRFDAFGWSTIVLDGHNFSEIDAVYQKAIDHQDGPVAIIAKTIKGKGVSFLEDKNGWHGKALTKEDLAKALKELGPVDTKIVGKVAEPGDVVYLTPEPSTDPLPAIQNYDKPVATRVAFGNALVRLGANHPMMMVLDGDVQNSTYTELFAKAYRERFIECYIAEQNMVGVALGLAKRGYVPWVATFSVFFTRAHDQIRLAALSDADIKFCGSHAGVAIGADGPSQMGLEDIAVFRGIQGSTVLSSSDPYQTERLVEAMMQIHGIAYLRTMREATSVIYSANDEFPIGGSKVWEARGQGTRDKKHGTGDKGQKMRNTPVSRRLSLVTVVATGVTVHEALKAQKELAKAGIEVRVIDCYSIKPIDVATLKKAAKETKAIIIVEDHHPEGGLGEAVKSALAGNPVRIEHLAVYKTPRSGTPEELLAYEEIDANIITKTIRSLLKASE